MFAGFDEHAPLPLSVVLAACIAANIKKGDRVALLRSAEQFTDRL
jgi:hypothetical protein